MLYRCVVGLFLLLAGGGALCMAQSAGVTGLDPQLREALAKDAACESKADATASTAMGSQVSEGQFSTQMFHGVPGGLTGVIATPTGGCQCEQGNCSTFVYVKSGPSYKLVLKEKLATLRLMRVYKHGLPSLTGKFQVNESRAETKVFDWDGNTYQATLCATVTQTSNPKRPSIVKHECRKSSAPDQP